jgi:ectoine hydroxylase-related dioxygenase (phytanoyl-CoA dioxygenase family)
MIRLTEDAIRRFRADGFLVLPSVLSPDELRLWRLKADAEASRSSVRDLGRGYTPSHRSKNFSRNDPEWAGLTQNPSLLETAAQLANVGSLRLIGEQLSYCDPNYPATPWHCQQLEDIIVDDRRALAAHILLDDNTVQGKAYVFLPGTHLDAPIGKVQLRSPSMDPGWRYDSIFEIMPTWREIDPVAVECPAGSVLFYHLCIAHGCGPNMTRAIRRYVGIFWAPAEATWNGRGAGSTGSRTEMNVGDPLDDMDHPIVWPRRST